MLFGLFGKKGIDMRTVAHKQEVISRELKQLKERLASAHSKFDARYSEISSNYKKGSFAAAYDSAFYAGQDLLSSCDFYLKGINEHYGAARYIGFTPFSSYEVFAELVALSRSLLKAQVLMLVCTLKLREASSAAPGMSNAISLSEGVKKLASALLGSNKRIGKGDKSPSGLKISKCLDVFEADSADILRLARKKGLSEKDLEASKAIGRF